MNGPHEGTRFAGISRRKLLKASAVGIGTFGLAGCTVTVDSQDPPTSELDLETLEADTEFGTLQAKRAENSYVGWIDDGRVIGIASLDQVGAGDSQDGDDGIVVHLYDREDLAIMLGAVDADGAATLESEELSDFEATAELTVENELVAGTVTVSGEVATGFTADAATGTAGVYWAHGSDEEPDVSGVGSFSPTAANGAVFVTRHSAVPAVICSFDSLGREGNVSDLRSVMAG